MNVVDLNVIEFRNNGVIDSLTHAPAPAIFLRNLEREFARAKRLAHPELSTHSQTESKWTDSHISIISLRWEPPKIIESADCEYIEAQMVAMARSIVKLLRGDEFFSRISETGYWIFVHGNSASASRLSERILEQPQVNHAEWSSTAIEWSRGISLHTWIRHVDEIHFMEAGSRALGHKR